VRHFVNLEKLVDDAGTEGIACASGEYVKRVLQGSAVTYRGEMAKSSFSGSGSDHTRSAIGPS
jgi:hypothetical protein